MNLIVCVRCRAACERAQPGMWLWTEAPAGLTCVMEGCARSADAVGEPRVKRGRPGHPQSAETRAKMSAADGELLEAEG